MGKGFGIDGPTQHPERITRAGFRYVSLLMLGAGGKGNRAANVATTAQLLNRFKPFTIATVATAVPSGNRLAAMRAAGAYKELTKAELLDLLGLIKPRRSIHKYGQKRIKLSDFGKKRGGGPLRAQCRGPAEPLRRRHP